MNASICVLERRDVTIENETILQQKEVLLNGELIIGLACATGTNSVLIENLISEEFRKYDYDCDIIKISKQLITPNIDMNVNNVSPYERAEILMNGGNDLRQQTEKNYILSCGVANIIHATRTSESMHKKKVFIIDSLKHPDEVDKLREIYPLGFYLFAIHESEEERIENLYSSKGMRKEEAQKLVQRDISENLKHGQHTQEVFELADFHLASTFPWIDKVYSDSDKSKNLKKQIERIVALIFGNPFFTPTFDEYAMFMAYSSGLRSADLSRQVGAVLTRDNEIIATGANEVPSYGGGQYWMNDHYEDEPNGRDYMRGWDSNKQELSLILDKLVEKLQFDKGSELERSDAKDAFLDSPLKNLTEYGRPVHAEMAAIMSCARNGIAVKGATLYCSTFPCHNCAKHIIAAGIEKVVFVEPYPKSKTLKFYNDSVSVKKDEKGNERKVWFCEFVGIGPRRFYDLFSMNLSSGKRLQRKESTGKVVDWSPQNARLRCQMLPSSYIEREAFEAIKWSKSQNNRNEVDER